MTDFAESGHLALVGAPQSGKSTLLRTMMLSAMLTHTPDEAQFLCLDLGGARSSPSSVPHTSVAWPAGTICRRRDESWPRHSS
ncbi:FtsK/SpoIIIE domain-containing protein [Streptomyces sp. M10(2022)]